MKMKNASLQQLIAGGFGQTGCEVVRFVALEVAHLHHGILFVTDGSGHGTGCSTSDLSFSGRGVHPSAAPLWHNVTNCEYFGILFRIQSDCGQSHKSGCAGVHADNNQFQEAATAAKACQHPRHTEHAGPGGQVLCRDILS